LRIPDALLKCVAFISDAGPNPTYVGTAFIVGVAGKHGNSYAHAVTARHVAETFEGKPFRFGVNFKDGHAGWLESDLQWWYHPTEANAVDVAVTPFAASERTDVEYVPEGIFTAKERIQRYNIGVGDEINVVGLFTRFFGSTKHIPIVRTGNIAMMPTDKMPVNDGEGETDVYLVEGRSIGGLSGSPVFVRHTISIDGVATKTGELQRVSGVSQLHLLGLIHGHWDLQHGGDVQEAEAVNMGIALVIPAHKILEVLYHPELVAVRQQQDEKYLRYKESGKIE
jgi:hypothetical protein